MVSLIEQETAAPPLVSIGIPTYGRPDRLRNALECALGQSYQNLEVIVSDNASPGSETERVTRELMERDSRVRYYRQSTNTGPSRNFNFVLQMATGKYFAWFADDDLCDPDFIRELAMVLEGHPSVGLAMSDLTMVKTSDETVQAAVSEIQLTSLRIEEASRSWPSVRRRFFAYPPSTKIYFCIYGLYRTEVLRRCAVGVSSRWKGITYASEQPVLAQMAIQAKIVSVARTLKTYFLHADSTFIIEKRRLGRLDRLIRNFELRVELTRIAARSELPWKDRLQLAMFPWVSRVVSGPTEGVDFGCESAVRDRLPVRGV